MTTKTPSQPLTAYLTFIIGISAYVGLMLVAAAILPPTVLVGFGVLAFAVLVLLMHVITPPENSLLARFIRWIVNQRRTWVVLSAGATLIMMFIATVYYQVSEDMIPQGLLWTYAGGLAVVGGLLLTDMRRFLPTMDINDAPKTQANTHHRTRWIMLGIAVVMLLLVAEISGMALAIPALENVSSHIQFALWISGVLLAGYALAGRRMVAVHIHINERDDVMYTRAITPTWGERLRSINRGEVLAVAVILVLALFMRTYGLASFMRFWIDEVLFSNPVTHFYSDPYVKLMRPFSSIAAFPYVYPYLQSHGVYLLGTNLAGLRIVSAVLGVAGVGALYLLARTAFGVRVALVGAALLAVLPMHVQHSRIGLNNIADPFFGAMMLYFLLRGLKRPEHMPGHFAWAGVMLGLTQYFYEGGRLLFPLLAFCWLAVILFLYLLHYGIQAIQGHAAISLMELNKRRRSILVMLIAAMLVAAPVYYTLAAQELSAAQRLETAGLGDQTQKTMREAGGFINHFSNRLREVYAIHVSIPESGMYYASDDPLIPPVTLPFFFIGGFYAIWLATLGTATNGQNQAKDKDNPHAFITQAAAILLLLWIAGTWAGNTLMEQSRIAPRYVVELPAVVLVIALGMDAIIGMVFVRRARRVVLVVALVGLVGIQANYYFGPYRDRFNVQFRTEQRGHILDIYDLVYRAADLPEGTIVYIVDDPLPYTPDISNMLQFLRGDPRPTLQVNPINPKEVKPDFIDNLNPNQIYAIFINPRFHNITQLFLDEWQGVDGPYYSGHEPAQGSDYTLLLRHRMAPDG